MVAPTPAAGPASAYAPSHPPAERYGDEDGGRPDASGRVLLEVARAAARDAGTPPPAWSEPLARVAEDLARAMPPEGAPPNVLVDFLLGYHGVIDPEPHLIVLHGDARAPLVPPADLRAQIAAVLREERCERIGAGAAPPAGGVARWVLALGRRDATIEPVARAHPLGALVPVAGRVAPRFARLEALRTVPSGAVEHLAPRGALPEFAFDVACDQGAGRYQVELVGDGGRGPEVLANFALWCGVAPPAEARFDAHPRLASTESDAEQALYDRLNRERAVRGLAPLAIDDRLRGMARAHSQDMRDHGFVGHVSPSLGDPAARARAFGLTPPLLLENVARAYSPGEAHEGLMGSPGHRQNILNADATHVGVGVVFGREAAPGQPELFVTETFAHFPPTDPAQALALARASVARRRAQDGLPALAADEELDALAAQVATDWAGGVQPTTLTAAALRDRWPEVRTLYVTTGDPAAVGTSDAVRLAGPTHVGIGLARGRDPATGDTTNFVVVILARRR